MTDAPMTKGYLLEGFKYLLDALREQLNDASIVGTERSKLMTAYREALAKSVTLVRETDQDVLEARLDELLIKIEKIQNDGKNKITV